MGYSDAHHAAVKHIDRSLDKSFGERAAANYNTSVVVLERAGDNLGRRSGILVDKHISLDVPQMTVAMGFVYRHRNGTTIHIDDGVAIIDITADCDYDALVVRVNKDGPACHTGAESCFHNPIFESDENSAFSLEGLMDMLQGRKDTPKEGSYTSYLFDKGLDKILKKVGEESTEVIIAGKAEDKAETIYEIADLAYHVLVLMVQMGAFRLLPNRQRMSRRGPR